MHEPAGRVPCASCDRVTNLFHVRFPPALLCAQCLQPELPFPDHQKEEK
jgi:hypothetical protein